MATSKTASFWLTEALEVDIAQNTATGEIDLGSLVDVGDQQALSIEEVHFIYQWVDAGGTYSSQMNQAYVGNSLTQVQVTDLNPGGLQVRADTHSLIASGALMTDDVNNIYTQAPDVYPDNYGKLDQGRTVVNDKLYMNVYTNPVTAAKVWVTARIKCRIVKLGVKDWMALSLTAVASD